MDFHKDADTIRWRMHLTSTPEKVYRALATDNGRALFWAESAVEMEGEIHFQFPNGMTWRGAVVADHPPHRFALRYFGGSLASFELADDGAGGTDLTLTDTGVPAPDRTEVIAGWVSVLMALKAAVDFSVDLRNHDPQRTWDQGYADN
jgi:uncharacterized protein YndB with AHSA1/START domain